MSGRVRRMAGLTAAARGAAVAALSMARGHRGRVAAHRCSENMCLSCSSGPRSTAKLAIESIEPSVKKRQNFCGRSRTSGRKAPASMNMHADSSSIVTNGFQRWRDEKGSPSPKPERKGTVLLSRLPPPRSRHELLPRLQSKVNDDFSFDSESGSAARRGDCCVHSAAVTPGHTSPPGLSLGDMVVSGRSAAAAVCARGLRARSRAEHPLQRAPRRVLLLRVDSTERKRAHQPSCSCLPPEQVRPARCTKVTPRARPQKVGPRVGLGAPFRPRLHPGRA